jgi:hypothetical protein
VTVPGAGTFGPGLVIVGGNGSGLFDKANTKLDGSTFPIRIKFGNGGAVSVAFDSRLSDAFIQSQEFRILNADLFSFLFASLAQANASSQFRILANDEDREKAEKCK